MRVYEAYGLLFDWDPDKARINLARHGVSFGEAASVFGDPRALYGQDDEHTTPAEFRQVVTGSSDRQQVLTVIFTERQVTLRVMGNASVVIVRLITAARASRRERHDYEEK